MSDKNVTFKVNTVFGLLIVAGVFGLFYYLGKRK